MTTSRIVLFLILIYASVFSLWPAYIDFRIATSVGLNPQRMLLALILLVFTYSLIIDKSFRTSAFGALRNHRTLVYIALVYSAIRLGSGLIKGPTPTFIATYEFISNIALMLITMATIKSQRDARAIFMTFMLCAVAISIYAVFEKQFQSNLLTQFADANTKAGYTAIFDKTRDGEYRAQSTFEHPLSLAQYLVIVAPLSLVFIRSRTWLPLALAAIIIIPTAAIFTGTRSALVAPFGALLVLLVLLAYQKYKARRTNLTSLTLIAVTTVTLLASIIVLPKVILGSGSQASSTSTRIAQMHNGYLAIKGSPLIGYGPGNASSMVAMVGQTNIDSVIIYGESLDNLFLSRAVESGLPALVAFVAMLLYIIKNSAENIKIAQSPSERRISIVTFLSVTGGIITMLALSIFTILPALFIIAGASLSRAFSHATTAHKTALSSHGWSATNKSRPESHRSTVYHTS